MENFDECDSLPSILKETENIYKSWELNKEELHKSRNELEQKYRYLAHLEKQKDEIMKTVAEKQATLSTLQTHAKYYESTNTELKNRAVKITEIFDELSKEMNSLMNDCTDVENRLNKIENTHSMSEQSKKQIDALQNQIDKLKSDLEDKRKDAEKRTCVIVTENDNLKRQLSYMEDLMNVIDQADDENSLTLLEQSSIELEKKIDALKKENDSLKSEYEIACQSLDQTKLENIDLNLKCNQVNDEINSLVNCLTAVKDEHTQLAASKDDLEKLLKQLDDQLCEADKIWNGLQNENYPIKHEIDQIKQDIADREKQFNIRKGELAVIHQLIEKENENIEQLTADIDKMNAESDEITKAIEDAELSQRYADQADQIKQKITAVDEEKQSLLRILEIKEEELKTVSEQLNNDRNSNAVELMTLKNHHAVEISAMEKKLADLKLTSSKLETEVKSSEDVENELEEALKKLKDKQMQLCAEFKQTEKELEELRGKSEQAPAKTQVVKKPRASPKTKEDIAKPPAKRNWDSDSSMEVEEIKFNDYLKRKSKKVYKEF